MSPYQKHGGLPYKECEELNIDPKEIIDFSASINPYPLPQEIIDAMSQRSLKEYPDPHYSTFKKRVAQYHNTHSNFITPLNGATEAIFQLPHLFERVLIKEPTYGDYREVFERHKKQTLLLDNYNSLPSTTEHDILVVVSPNNPTGESTSLETIHRILINHPHLTVLIDESYLFLSEAKESALSLIENHQNLWILHSLTKSFGIATLRGGYLIAQPQTSQKLIPYLPRWSINGLLDSLIPHLFDHIEHFQKEWKQILQEKKSMIERLAKAGYEVESENAPFFLVTVSDPSFIRKVLLKSYKLHVRDCTSFGLSDKIRVMPSLPKNNNLLIEALIEKKGEKWL